MIKKGNFVWADDNKTSAKFEEDKSGRYNVRFWKPNLLQRFMYWLGLKKDPRYNGKRTRFVEGFDPYDIDKP